jgi:predicted transcriptional regulator
VNLDGVVRLLAEPARLKVFSALVLGARTPADIIELTGLETREVGTALRKLADGGLVELSRQGALPLDRVFAELARQTVKTEPVEDHGYADARAAGVLRAFVRGGRLLGMPASRSRRVIVLEHIVQSFEPGVDYPEPEVNAMLTEWTAGSGVDHVTVRRYLIDEDLLRRVDGIYRRSGGWTDVSA